jgi:hypothetical protein
MRTTVKSVNPIRTGVLDCLAGNAIDRFVRGQRDANSGLVSNEPSFYTPRPLRIRLTAYALIYGGGFRSHLANLPAMLPAFIGGLYHASNQFHTKIVRFTFLECVGLA